MKRNSTTWFARVFLTALAIAAGCTESPQQDARPSMPVANDSAAGAPGRHGGSEKMLEDDFDPTGYVDIDGLKFKIPLDWERVELTDIQRGIISARYLIPKDDQQLQLTFSLVKGGIEANFQRWIGQFQLDPGTKPFREWLTVDGEKAEWIELHGTYSGAFRPTGEPPQTGYALVGAGLPAGEHDMYLKLTGPAKLVDAVKDSVRDVVISARLQ